MAQSDRLGDLLRRFRRRAGLTDVRWRTGTGWQRGILHTVLARRPG